jgi:hypothetical protein
MSSLWPPTADGIKTVTTVLTLLFGGGILTNAYSKWRKYRQQKLAVDQLSGDFLSGDIKSALRYYVEHEVSAIDPAGREVDRASLGPQEPLFRLLDRTLYKSDDKQHLLLLADSGMGKTTALLNYYAYNAKRRKSHPIVMFSLRTQGVEAKIALVENKSGTVLFLDALDEDPTAISDHTMRLHTLFELAREFRAVLISCRSQFFLTSEEITKETGLARIRHRGLGEAGEYMLYKFYLCPLSNQQVKTFLKKRYPFPYWYARRRACISIEQVRDLTARPMLLAYVDDLARSDRNIANVTEAYSEIVEQWIKREKPFVENDAALLEFSKKLAVDLYIRREQRGGEQAPAREILGLAHEWNIPLQRWQLTGRSLLTRDATDQFRFAHRSILEYLFVRSFLEGDTQCATVEWTDQMYLFLLSMLNLTRASNLEDEMFLQRIPIVVNTLRRTASIGSLDITLPLNLLDRLFTALLIAVREMRQKHESAPNRLLLDQDFHRMLSQEFDRLVSRTHIRPLVQLVFARCSGQESRVNLVGIVPNKSGKGFRLTAHDGVIWYVFGLSETEQMALSEISQNFEWNGLEIQTYTHKDRRENTIFIPFTTADRVPFGFIVVVHFSNRLENVENVDDLLDRFRSWMNLNHQLSGELARLRPRFGTSLWGANADL